MPELKIARDRSVPAAIQFKNPGAMWGKGNPLATKWGSSGWVMLKDGLGQGNNIAVFPSWVLGICAQLDMWRTSAHYKNKRFADAINIWDGGNNTPSYIALVKARVPGMNENTIMNDAFWRSSMATQFLKVQATHEAGKTIPAAESDWIEAQRKVFAGQVPLPVATKKTVAAAVAVNTTTTSTAVAATHSGAPLWAVAAIILLGIGISVFAAWFFHRNEHAEPEVGDGLE